MPNLPGMVALRLSGIYAAKIIRPPLHVSLNNLITELFREHTRMELLQYETGCARRSSEV